MKSEREQQEVPLNSRIENTLEANIAFMDVFNNVKYSINLCFIVFLRYDKKNLAERQVFMKFTQESN